MNLSTENNSFLHLVNNHFRATCIHVDSVNSGLDIFISTVEFDDKGKLIDWEKNYFPQQKEWKSVLSGNEPIFLAITGENVLTRIKHKNEFEGSLEFNQEDYFQTITHVNDFLVKSICKRSVIHEMIEILGLAEMNFIAVSIGFGVLLEGASQEHLNSLMGSRFNVFFSDSGEPNVEATKNSIKEPANEDYFMGYYAIAQSKNSDLGSEKYIQELSGGLAPLNKRLNISGKLTLGIKYIACTIVGIAILFLGLRLHNGERIHKLEQNKAVSESVRAADEARLAYTKFIPVEVRKIPYLFTQSLNDLGVVVPESIRFKGLRFDASDKDNGFCYVQITGVVEDVSSLSRFSEALKAQPIIIGSSVKRVWKNKEDNWFELIIWLNTN